MPQSLEAFRLFFSFADTLAARINRPADDLVFEYTPLPLSLGTSATPDFCAALKAAHDKPAFAHAHYLARTGPDPKLGDPTYQGHQLFGSFYYVLQDDKKTIRPHIAKLYPFNHSPLGHPETSKHDLKAMFAHIKQHEPQATDVRGNSWLYNLSAYRSLYPAPFTQSLPASAEHEFKYMALWGQFFTRHWQLKSHFAVQLRDAVSKLDDLTHLRLCFPYQVLTPTAPINTFYKHYSV